jgi:hypothetical protein
MQNNIRVHFPRGVSGSFLINCIMYYTHPEYFLKLSLGPEGNAHPQLDDLTDLGKLNVVDLKKHMFFLNNTSHSATKLDDKFTTVFIKCQSDDYGVITDMFLNKVLVWKIDLEEYNIIKGANWASFEKWTTCEFTRQEIKDMWVGDLELWNNQAQFSEADYVISFKDIHFDPVLNQRIATLAGMQANETVQQYIEDYRNANRIYWK